MARSYDDFEPLVDWTREGGYHIFMVDLPGFKREHLRLQLDSAGILNISGESPVLGNKWRRFRKEVLVPEKCNPADIQAKFEDGILYVVFPKPITGEDIYEASPVEESPVGQKTGEMPDSIDNHNDTHSTGGRTGGGGNGDKGTSAVGANKQRSESTDDANVVNKMMSKDKGKMVHGSRESAGDGGVVKESSMQGGGLVLGLDDRSRQLMENLVVAFLVVVAAFGIYMWYVSFRSPKKF